MTDDTTGADAGHCWSGWLYENPDTGQELSNNHPVRSGECDNAQNIRPATRRALRNALLYTWVASAEDRQQITALAAENAALREALFMCASHCQGGHSTAGAAAADALGVAFPITMSALEVRATEVGLDPQKLWPWLFEIRRARAARALKETGHG